MCRATTLIGICLSVDINSASVVRKVDRNAGESKGCKRMEGLYLGIAGIWVFGCILNRGTTSVAIDGVVTALPANGVTIGGHDTMTEGMRALATKTTVGGRIAGIVTGELIIGTPDVKAILGAIISAALQPTGPKKKGETIGPPSRSWQGHVCERPFVSEAVEPKDPQIYHIYLTSCWSFEYWEIFASKSIHRVGGCRMKSSLRHDGRTGLIETRSSCGQGLSVVVEEFVHHCRFYIELVKSLELLVYAPSRLFQSPHMVSLQTPLQSESKSGELRSDRFRINIFS